MALFTARFVPHFADQPEGQSLYEVNTPEGERIASATDRGLCETLAHNLNRQCHLWAASSGPDAVVG